MVIKCCLICCCVVILLFASISGGFMIWAYKNVSKGALPTDYTVTDASLNKFSMTPNKTIEYDLALTISVENKWTALEEIKWTKFETVPVYKDVELQRADLAPFEIKRKGKKEVNGSYKGTKATNFAGDDASKMKSAKSFEIVLKLEGKKTNKLTFKIDNEFKYECKLKVPLKSGGEKFESTKCEKK